MRACEHPMDIAVSLQIALHSLVGAILVLHGHQLGGSRSGNQDWYRVWMRVRARDERQGSVTVVARQRMDGPILRLSSAGSSVVRLYGSLWLPGVRALRHTACRSADGSCGGAGGVPAGRELGIAAEDKRVRAQWTWRMPSPSSLRVARQLLFTSNPVSAQPRLPIVGCAACECAVRLGRR